MPSKKAPRTRKATLRATGPRHVAHTEDGDPVYITPVKVDDRLMAMINKQVEGLDRPKKVYTISEIKPSRKMSPRSWVEETFSD
jgi:hypothetical protein